MSSWTDLLERAEPKEHVVHLYGEDDQLLTRHVSRYVAEGLRRGDGLLVIATGEHSEAIARRLEEEGADATAAMRDGRLVFLDAEATLARFLVNGQPSWPLFEEVVGGVMHDLRTRMGHGKVRAFGEMVGLLWGRGNVSAALCVEEYWNRVVESHAITLFCAYPIDAFDGDFDVATLNALLGAHTHLFAAPRTLFSSPSRHQRV